jgi:hypothetical protein
MRQIRQQINLLEFTNCIGKVFFFFARMAKKTVWHVGGHIYITKFPTFPNCEIAKTCLLYQTDYLELSTIYKFKLFKHKMVGIKPVFLSFLYCARIQLKLTPGKKNFL